MPGSPFRIGLVQFDIAWESPQKNMHLLEKVLGDQQGYDLILLPEMWPTGFTMHPETVAEQFPGPALAWMIEQSHKLKCCLAGSIPVATDHQYTNRLFCTYPDGRFAFYDKKHLFSYGKENHHYSAGTSRIVLDINGWRILPVICYDLRFPVWCRNIDDYDLMIVVANWPQGRIHHWDALLKARAIENQCYVAAVNRIGQDANGLDYPGHSSVYDMNGEMLVQMKDAEGIGSAILDIEALIAYREHFRFLQDRDGFLL